jgi:hypothetical protein
MRQTTKNRTDGGKYAPKWDDSFYLKSYFLAKSGMSDSLIGQTLGTDKWRFKIWLKKNPALREAVARGRSSFKGAKWSKGQSGRAEGEKFFEYVYKRLPPELKELWDEVMRLDRAKNPEARIAALLDGRGELTRMHLWVHALVTSNFSESEACRKVMVSNDKLKDWKTDKDFQGVIDALVKAKKDFVEESAMSLVAAGDPTVVWNMNRTLNADRGYDPARKVRVDVAGAVGHLHAAFPLEEFLRGLPLEARRQWLEWVRAAEAKALPPKAVPVTVDALPAEDPFTDD